MLTPAEEETGEVQRHPPLFTPKVEYLQFSCFLSLQVGFLSSGRVVALDVSYYSNAGNSLDLSLSVSITHRIVRSHRLQTMS